MDSLKESMNHYKAGLIKIIDTVQRTLNGIYDLLLSDHKSFVDHPGLIPYPQEIQSIGCISQVNRFTQ